MFPPLVLRVEADLQGGWCVWVGAPDVPPARGRLDAGAVAAIKAASRAAGEPGPVAIQGSARRMERAEEAAGRALAEVLASAAVAGRVAEHQTRATVAGAAFLIAVDCPSPEIGALPWELLALAPDGAPVEEGVGAIARLSTGVRSDPRPTASTLRVLVWSPTEGEPACRTLLAALRVEVPGVEHTVLPSSLPLDLPPEAPDCADLLVVVCHGDRVDGGTHLQLGDGAGPGALVPDLVANRQRLTGVLLGVCDAGAPSEDQLSDLAGRLLLGGVPAVVCSAVPVGADALASFTAGFARALADEDPLGVAACIARRAVRRLLIPHPQSRPSTFRLHVTQLPALAAPWIVRRWRPDGWPPVDKQVEQMLLDARSAARDGWFGLEHLLVAWPEGAPGLPGALRRALVGWNADLLARLRSGSVAHRPAGTLLCTPRIRRLAAAFPSKGATLVSLAAALVEDASHALHLLADEPLARIAWDPLDSQATAPSLGSRAAGAAGAPATRFEVLWGPEDGRQLILAPGETLGRWRADAADPHVLYADTPTLDRHLHRSHLRFHRPGEVELLHRSRLVPLGGRLGDALEVRGPIGVLAGDVLLLSPGTWLRALA